MAKPDPQLPPEAAEALGQLSGAGKAALIEAIATGLPALMAIGAWLTIRRQRRQLVAELAAAGEVAAGAEVDGVTVPIVQSVTSIVRPGDALIDATARPRQPLAAEELADSGGIWLDPEDDDDGPPAA